jgi:hypothetical protein
MTFDELLPPADTEPPGTEVETPFDLLLEQPDIPATRIAAPAAATVSPRLTCSPLPDVAVLGIEGRLGSMRVNWAGIQNPKKLLLCSLIGRRKAVGTTVADGALMAR